MDSFIMSGKNEYRRPEKKYFDLQETYGELNFSLRKSI